MTPNIPSQSEPQTFVSDASGNLFIISYIVTASGRPQIHIDKTDPHGNIIARFDFGGSDNGIGLTDSVAGAVIDPQGNLVIVGTTSSADFPLLSPLITSTANYAAFITKIDPLLQKILFSTELSGTGAGTSAGAVAVDKSGNIFITGSTGDTDFPVTPGAYQTQPPQSNSVETASYAFVTEIRSDDKAIVFSTYFGDSNISCTGSSFCSTLLPGTFATTIALDAPGNIVIAGDTTADKLPVTPGVFGPNCGACGQSATAGFLAKFSGDGSKLLWSTYLPVVATPNYNAELDITAMMLDAAGDVVIAGTTPPGLQVTAGSLQTSFPGPTTPPAYAGFVMKLDAAAQGLIFSTYFGGVDPISDLGVHGLLGDSQGTIWITGASPADQLPVRKGSAVLGELYLAALSPAGSSLAAIFTAPMGAAGVAIALTSSGVTALGNAGTLLTASPGQGPSLVGVGNAAGNSVSNAIAPYELISLYGLGIGPQTTAGAQVVSGVVTNSLEGVQVLFDGTPAPLLYVGPTQINAVVPSEVYGQDTSTLQIVTPSGTVNGPTMSVRTSQPGVFVGSGGIFFTQSAAALNQDGSVNSASNPAALGSIVTVLGQRRWHLHLLAARRNDSSSRVFGRRADPAGGCVLLCPGGTLLIGGTASRIAFA
jgi:hypothetical protein